MYTYRFIFIHSFRAPYIQKQISYHWVFTHSSLYCTEMNFSVSFVQFFFFLCCVVVSIRKFNLTTLVAWLNVRSEANIQRDDNIYSVHTVAQHSTDQHNTQRPTMQSIVVFTLNASKGKMFHLFC